MHEVIVHYTNRNTDESRPVFIDKARMAFVGGKTSYDIYFQLEKAIITDAVIDDHGYSRDQGHSNFSVAAISDGGGFNIQAR